MRASFIFPPRCCDRKFDLCPEGTKRQHQRLNCRTFPREKSIRAHLSLVITECPVNPWRFGTRKRFRLCSNFKGTHEMWKPKTLRFPYTPHRIVSTCPRAATIVRTAQNRLGTDAFQVKALGCFSVHAVGNDVGKAGKLGVLF